MDITNTTTHVGYKNSYRYRGYRYDTETGLYYLQSRYYNPEWGRMLNADAVGGQVGDLLSHNVFSYCKNNPVNMHDPDGYWGSSVLEKFRAHVYVTLVLATAIVLQVMQSNSVLQMPTYTTRGRTKSTTKPAVITNTQTKKNNNGPVICKPPKNATPTQIAQTISYVAGCNAALQAGYISPVGRVPTAGLLRDMASDAAAAERKRAKNAGNPYTGVAGHVPDTTWTSNPVPFMWMDLDSKVNSSLGGQSNGYPFGYKPTVFIFSHN